MSEAIIAGKEPAAVELEAGETYYWCSCGRSAKQPFCDGTHKGSDFEPVAFTAVESKTAYLCVCKQSGTKQFCDGSHKSL